jgi:hypothetical protein
VIVDHHFRGRPRNRSASLLLFLAAWLQRFRLAVMESVEELALSSVLPRCVILVSTL